MTQFTCKNPRRRGLTLVELVVVLFILALTTTIAVRMTSSLEDQARFEATQRGLKEIDEAVVGAQGVRQPDGTISVQGFVADMGRLPIAQSADPALMLSELWANPQDSFGNALLPEFKIRDFPDPDISPTFSVKVPCGWRPQLHLAPGASSLLDGWSNPYGIRVTNAKTDPIPDPTSDPTPHNFVSSLQSAGFPEISGPLSLPRDWCPNRDPIQSPVIQGSVNVVVQVKDPSGVLVDPDTANGPVTVYLLGPDPKATAATVALNEKNAIRRMSLPASGSPLSAIFNGIYIGPKSIYARQPGATQPLYSDPAYISVLPGGIVNVKLVLHP